MRLVWFRNDLRTVDHRALAHACMKKNGVGEGVIAVAAITPIQWLQQDEAKSRVQFWLANLRALKDELASLNIPLKIVRCPTNKELPQLLLELAQKHQVSELFYNREYPEYESARDQAVERLFVQQGIACHRCESDLVIAPGQLLNLQGLPYKVFTPFSKAWRRRYQHTQPALILRPEVQPQTMIVADPIPEEIGYNISTGADWQPARWPAGEQAASLLLQGFARERFCRYKADRDLPGYAGTSSLSPYLSIGVLSTRQCIAAAEAYSDDPEWFENQWITELIWREFYRHLLVLFPDMNRWQPFKPEIEAKLSWQTDAALFDAWCRGETGFAVVDAGMKQLLETGWMHNRVRMITASFLTKLLRQDWRLGARFFMQHLIDGDFASNLGGWQWSASVGADAAPYFRIFNPMRQAERFDQQGDYVAQWIPALAELNSVQQHDPMFAQSYGRPLPVIDYAQARSTSIELYNAG